MTDESPRWYHRLYVGFQYLLPHHPLSALMFRNSSHSGLNMVYRRADGHIGWVDPRGNRG